MGYQKITCANCSKTIIEFLGGGWIEDGWVECKCGYETRVNKAIPSNESRRIESSIAGHPIRMMNNDHGHCCVEEIPRSEDSLKSSLP